MIIRDSPSRTLSTFALALVISLLLVTPLAFLELRHNPLTSRRVSDYVVLFGLLWLLPMASVMTVTPLVRAMRSGEGVLQSPFALGLKIVLLLAAAMTWLTIVSDQLPCFMGTPNCD